MPPIKKPRKLTTKVDSVSEKDKQIDPVISGQLEKKLKKKQQRKKIERGIVFLKHLPHGFFEEQLQKYFEQFGTVTRLRLGRSTRTGGGKGYAFVEFEYPEVAKVAAETMDNYLMFKKVVKAAYIPPSEQKFNYFKTSLRKVKNKAGKEIYVSGKTTAIQRKVVEHNNWSDDVYQKRTKAGLKKFKKIQNKYAHLGLDLSNVALLPKKVDTDEKSDAECEIPMKNRKHVELVDLLGDTINDDSEDDDYVDLSDSEPDDMNSDDSDNNEDSEVEEKRESQNTLIKKLPKLDRFEHLIQRKPKSGGIQKNSMKKKKNISVNKDKKTMQISAAKELVKPLVKKRSKAATVVAKEQRTVKKKNKK